MLKLKAMLMKLLKLLKRLDNGISTNTPLYNGNFNSFKWITIFLKINKAPRRD